MVRPDEDPQALRPRAPRRGPVDEEGRDPGRGGRPLSYGSTPVDDADAEAAEAADPEDARYGPL